MNLMTRYLAEHSGVSRNPISILCACQTKWDPDLRRDVRFGNFRLFLILLCLFFVTFPAFAQTPKTIAPVTAAPTINSNDVCKGRAGCRVLWSSDAGAADKKRFIISEVVIPHEAKNEWEKCRRPQDARFGEFLDNVGQEIWLSTLGGILPEHKKLFELCNNGYGEAKLGEDKFAFSNQEITYRQSGGGNDRWVWARSYALPSLAATRTLLCDYKTAYSGGHMRVMDYETGSFTSGYSPRKNDDDAQENFIDCEKNTIADSKAKYKAMDTKQISSFLGIKLGDIKTLGTCATTMTSKAGSHQGYLIYGQDDGADVEVKFLRINDDKLWIDARDVGRNFKTSDNWANDDRIEIWWLDQKALNDKPDSPRKALRQFSIRLADLKVFAGYGYGNAPKMPNVERRNIGADISLVVTWPLEQYPSANGLTLSYAHADGSGTKVMWSTSDFKYADPLSLAPVRKLQEENPDPTQSCTISKDGVLNLAPPLALGETSKP